MLEKILILERSENILDSLGFLGIIYKSEEELAEIISHFLGGALVEERLIRDLIQTHEVIEDFSTFFSFLYKRTHSFNLSMNISSMNISKLYSINNNNVDNDINISKVISNHNQVVIISKNIEYISILSNIEVIIDSDRIYNIEKDIYTLVSNKLTNTSTLSVVSINKESKYFKIKANVSNNLPDKSKPYNNSNTYNYSNNINIYSGDEIVVNKKEQSINDIFAHWNSKGIIKHRTITSDIKKAITSALKKFGKQELITAITRYAQMLDDENYFFKYKWSLRDFMSRKDGVASFMDDGSKWVNYYDYVKKNSAKKIGGGYDVI